VANLIIVISKNGGKIQEITKFSGKKIPKLPSLTTKKTTVCATQAP
jgi:hypothetical protein